MGRTLLIVSITLLVGLPVLAQRGGGGHGGGGGMHDGFGGGMRGSSSGMRPGFGDRFHGGFNAFHGGFPEPNHNNSRIRNFDRPALSLFDSGYPSDYSQRYDSSNAAYQSSGSAVIAVQLAPNIYSYVPADDPATPVPPAIQEFATPPPQTSSSYAPMLYLIAFRDNSISAALAYWTEGSTLRYVTMDHEQKQAPLAAVDRTLSERLNGERHVLFRLPLP
jgi:hypothetical protein